VDWFKVQTVWGASVERFSDAEAGRFIKALFAYVRHGEEYDGSSGREDPLIWQALETLREDVESLKQKETSQRIREEAIKEKRRQAAKARWSKQTDANECKTMQMDANAQTSTICIANASQNKNIDTIKETPLKGSKEKRGRFSPPSVEEVDAYCKERGNKINAQTFVDFYASKGWRVGNNQMKDWKACVRTWEQRENSQAGSSQKPRLLRAQDYEQREYNEAEMEEALGVRDLFEMPEAEFQAKYGRAAK
jgi:hypothetical protein